MTALDPHFGHWLLSSLRSGLVAIDGQGYLIELNPDAMRILFGRGSAAADAEPGRLGKHCDEALASQPGVAELLLAALDGRERPGRAELTLEAADGASPCTIGFTITCVRDELGTVRGAAMQFRDLTPYERADEQDRLRERLAALGQMAAGVAHELRNPLASTEILAGLLAREVDDDSEAGRLTEELLEELRRMASIIDASLSFVRTDAARYQAVNPKTLVIEVVNEVGSGRPEEIALELEVGDCPTRVWLDEEMLRSILSNLVGNAVEALTDFETPTQPRIHVSLGAEGEAPGDLVFRVADNGPGIPDELRERIFYPFFTTRDEGSGVGLALAQKLAAAHGGSLLLERRQGGACFAARIPIREEAPGLESGS